MLGTPIRDALAAVDEAVLMHLLERFVDDTHDARIEREDVARPVAGRAHPPHALLAHVLVFLHKIPYLFVKLLALHFEAASALFLQFLFEHHLGLEPRMVGAGEPERAFATHAGETDKDVLDGEEEGMAGVERRVRVRRRHDDAVGLSALVRQIIGIKKTGGLPLLVEFFLVRRGVVGLLEQFRHTTIITRSPLPWGADSNPFT